MLLPRVLLVPHWPPLLEDEHRRHRTPMLEALALEARRFVAEKPEIVVALSARWSSSGPFHVGSGRLHRTRTDDPAFGVEARYDCSGHPALARALIDAGAAARVRVGPSERGVDGGVSVPLHFLLPSRTLPVVPLSIARRPVEECRSWGAAIRRVLERRPERIGFVVGGMLSHATHAWNFRRDVPEATQLDEAVLAAFRAGEWDAIDPAADKWKERAHPEAGLRHLEVLRGFLGSDLPGEVICYEAGPGMGAALVGFPVTDAVSVATAEELAPPPRPERVVALRPRGDRSRSEGSRDGRSRNGARFGGPGRRPAGPLKGSRDRSKPGSETRNRYRDKPGAATPNRYRDKPGAATPNRYRDKPGAATPNRYRDKPGAEARNRYRDKPGAATPNRYRDKPGAATPNRYRDKPGAATPNRYRDKAGAASPNRDREKAGTETRNRYRDKAGTANRGRVGTTGAKRGKFAGAASAGSRTPRPRGRAPASRPARKPRG